MSKNYSYVYKYDFKNIFKSRVKWTRKYSGVIEDNARFSEQFSESHLALTAGVAG